MLKYFVIFYDSESRFEKLPDYLYFKKCNNILFKSVAEIPKNNFKLDCFWKTIKERYNLRDLIFILIHGKSSFNNLVKILEEDPTVKMVLNYSSGDPFYEDMWRDISRSKGCDDLAKVIEYWLRFYSIDPIRRLKHRFINSFQAVNIDLGRVIELIDEKNVAELKEHIEKYWKEKNDGPFYKLISFWYALVGESGLKWGERNLPAKPNVLLAKKKGEELTVYFHLKELFGVDKTKQMPEWVKLLNHCQLYQVCDGKFEMKHDNGIYAKSIELERLVQKVYLNEEEIEKLRTNSEYFIKWLKELNDLIEALIKACS